jgi:hypothetical protein
MATTTIITAVMGGTNGGTITDMIADTTTTEAEMAIRPPDMRVRGLYPVVRIPLHGRCC